MKRTFILLNALVILSAGFTSECKTGDKKVERLFEEPIVKYTKEENMAYVMNSLRMWNEIIKNYESECLSKPDNIEASYKLVRAYTGLLNACIGNQDKETFDATIENAEKALKSLIKLTPNWAKVYALESAIISAKLAFEPNKGMILGPRSQKAIEKALKLNENEALAWYQLGGSKLHTPEQFGGSITKAIESYKKAIELFEADTATIENNWQYIGAITWLGIAYDKNSDYNEAIKTYENVLKLEPDMGWVKFVLLPETNKKIAELSVNQ